MTQEKRQLLNILSQSTANALLKNGFEVTLVENADEALQILKNTIPKTASIGFGGSRTLEQIGFFDTFRVENYPQFMDRNQAGLTPDKKNDVQRKMLTADFFICSANALSNDGQLVFIDYNGNRNAAATYGPQKRIFVIGWNKISENLDEAMNRAGNTAAVLNNIRFGTPNPCTTKGHCIHCGLSDKLCKITTIISRCQPVKSALVILVKEDLGF